MARRFAFAPQAALELLEDVSDLDVVVAPVGGGGLLSGTAIVAKSMRPGIVVHGAEPANADDAARSLASGKVEPVAPTSTLADGLRTTLSPLTLEALRAHVTSIGLASEAGIVDAMRTTWQRMKIVLTLPKGWETYWRFPGDASASSSAVATSTSTICPGGTDRF